MIVIPTPHSVKRTNQRFRLFFRPGVDAKSFLINEVRKSEIEQKYSHSPFYKNKLESQHGKGTYIRKTDLVVFACVDEGKKTFIKTVFKNSEFSAW